MSDDDPFDGWDSAIGSYISSYAESERLVYKIYSLLPTDKLSKYGAELRDSAQRIRFLQALLRSNLTAHNKDLEQILESLIALGKTRNEVAHNPIFLDIYLSDDGERHSIKPFIHHSRKDERMAHITLDGLQRKKDELLDCCTKLIKFIDTVQETQ